jgi:hypothetical protein
MYTDDVEVNADNAQDLLDLSGQYQLYVLCRACVRA